jgi:hypothetical protein
MARLRQPSASRPPIRSQNHSTHESLCVTLFRIPSAASWGQVPSSDMSGQSRTPTDAKRPLPPRKRSPIVTQLVKQVHHSAKTVSLQKLTQRASERRSRCSEAHFMLVGDTGIEPVTSSVSGINTVRSNPPLSTKAVCGRLLMSAHIRGRCHAISQSPRQPHISGCPRTLHAFPHGEALPRTGNRQLDG